MTGRALSPSPIAVFLLGLAERGADGRVDIGGRSILLRKGQVVDVRPAEGDGDLAAFLRDSGRIAPEPLERCTARAREEGVPLEEILLRQRLLSNEALRDVRRAVWLDRLVRGLARAAAEGRDVSAVQPETRVPSDVAGANLVTLVLDALERRAADDDAGQVGARADHRLEWLETPHLERAMRWARIEADDTRKPVAALLKKEPAAAPRIAALVRAGLARIVSPDAPPAPVPRVGPLPASSGPTRNTPPLGSPAPALVERPRTITVQLDPALSPIFDDEPQLTTPLPEIPQPVARLDDPLDALERSIALLEQAGAPGPERAEAWRRFGDAWEERFGSLEEAARAHREAAAADPEDRVALARASELCAALGRADLAVAYARASVSAAQEPIERARALWGYALLCRRLGKLSEALGALRAAAAANPHDPEPLALSAYVWRELGRPRDAADAAARAAERMRDRDPKQALSLAALALALDPRAPGRAEAYAAELASNGLTEASVAVLADAARHSDDADTRRARLLAAAEQAELSDRPDRAADLLTRAFDAEPHVDLLYEPLDTDLAQANAPLERAVLLEEIAAAAPRELQASWLVRAADARFDVPGDAWWETELRIRALELAPDDAACWRAVREQAEASGDPRLLADALERALSRGVFLDPTNERRALEELARLAEDALDAPLRAAWALERLRASAPNDPAPRRALERLAPRIAAHRARRAELERDARFRARELADHLFDDPERRREALALHRALLDATPDDTTLGDAVERLARLLGDDLAEAGALELRAEHAPSRAERVRLRLRLAALTALAGRWADAASACKRILEELPSHREAALRLRRAASRLGDRALLREALQAETALALPPLERARALTALARELEDAGSLDEAVSCADAALAADPSSAEAALSIVRHVGAVGQPRAVLGLARALFGDAPPILEAWARATRDRGEQETMLEALEAWARVAPYDPGPWAERLSAIAAIETTSSLAAAIEGALEPERLVPSLAQPIATAIARLAELGDVATAARLAVRASDAFGPHGAALRELAGQLAAVTGERTLVRAALERRIAPRLGDERVELLHELAALHRDVGDRAAEARTHLRVLAVRTHDPRSLARLVALYAETNETERMMAALALELEAAPDAERIRPLLTLAAASAQLFGDLDRAEAFLRDAWKPELGTEEPLFQAAGALVELGRPRRAIELLRDAGKRLPSRRAAAVFLRAVQIALKKVDDTRLALSTAVEGLEHAPSSGHLLLAFEQTALALDDVDLAERTFHMLRERAMGPHGRSALAYRRAYWLERAGRARASLDAYLEAFGHAPRPGAVYASIERLARELGDLESLVRAALLLAERAAHPAVRASMAREAARLLEHELGASERAFDVLVRLWEEGEASDEDDLVRLAREMRARDAARGEAAFARVLDVLRKRADDAWLGEARARMLVRQGRVHALGRRDVDAALAAVEEAIAAVQEEGGNPELVASALAEAAFWLLDAGRPSEAASHVRRALRAEPANEAARALAEKLGVEVAPGADDTHELGPSVPNPAAAPPEPHEGATPLAAGGAADLDGPAAHPEPPRRALGAGAEHESSAAPSPTRVLLPPAMGRWRSAAPARGREDAEALERRASEIREGDPERALDLLRAALAIEPGRLSTLRAIAEFPPAYREAHAARSLLALTDPSLAPPEPLAPPPRAHLDELLRDDDQRAVRAIWALLWEQALPLFREAPASLPDANARVTRVATTSEARAFAAALDALGRDDLPPFYFDRAGEPALVLVRTFPPCILGGPGFAPDEAAMRFALGRALELSEPGHLLLATLPPARTHTVVAAVSAAFGPADGAAVPREAAVLASELWRTMPARAQSAVRDLLIEAGDLWLDDDAARRSVQASGARAGLVACGDLGVAVAALCASDAELAGLDLTTEDGLAHALAAPSVASLVRFALGPLALERPAD